MEKAQAKGELNEEDLRALEMDVTGKVGTYILLRNQVLSRHKIMLASWRGARLEVIQVLREVVDNVLKEPEQSEQVLINRAKVTNLFTSQLLIIVFFLVYRHFLSLEPYSRLLFLTSQT